jgi:hypothetical protein
MVTASSHRTTTIKQYPLGILMRGFYTLSSPQKRGQDGHTQSHESSPKKQPGSLQAILANQNKNFAPLKNSCDWRGKISIALVAGQI